MKTYSNFLALLASEFQKYLIEHEQAAAQLPKGALVIFRVEHEDTFNQWNEKLALKNREKKQPIVYVDVKKWRTLSTIEQVNIYQSRA